MKNTLSWKQYTIYNRIPAEIRDSIHTVRQWALMGYVPVTPGTGTALWTNRNCDHRGTYYSREEVREGTAEELREYFRPERERRNAQARAKRAEETRRRKNAEYRQKCEDKAASVPYEGHRTRTYVLDTETTGLRPYEDEILQLAIIDAEDGRTVYNQFFRPYIATEWREAERVNGISPEDVKDSPLVLDRIDEIQRILNEAETIIGYNTYFDLSFLEGSGVLFPGEIEVVDVMKEYSPERWVKLTECAAALGFKWKECKAHNALGDCLATLHCYNAMHTAGGR